MKRLYSFLLIVLFISFSVSTFAQHEHGKSAEYEWPNDQLVCNKLDKWQDKKFGVIFHWGLYAVPGIVESWRLCSEDEDWIGRDSTATYDKYKEWYWGLSQKFNPVKFNPEQWAQVAKNAGMRYVVFTTKHHDGFAMFDTKQSDFSIAHGAFKENPRADVAKYVFEAFRKKDFMIGAYYSKPDWHSEYYWWPRFATPNRNVNYSVEKHPWRWNKFKEFTYNQIGELMNNYGSIDILWLDGGWVAPPKQDIDMAKIAQMARKAQPGLLMVDRTIHGPFENYQTPEQTIPKQQLAYPWESCLTLGYDWGYVPTDKFKSPAKVIHTLIEVVAKGGSLLLGVGPSPEGLIPGAVVTRLNKIGAWMNINGASIYNTRITPFYHDANTWFTQSKDGKTIFSLVCLQEGQQMPSFVEWIGNIPRKGSSMTLLQTKKKVNWKIENGKVRVYLPQGLSNNLEALAFSFPKK